MEFTVIRRLFENKSIVNPYNQEEVFTCKDLYEDYRVCKKERRFMGFSDASVQARRCWDYRELAYKCFTYPEDDFIVELAKKYEEKQAYIKFLEAEGSIIADKFRKQSKIFSVRNTSSTDEGSYT